MSEPWRSDVSFTIGPAGKFEILFEEIALLPALEISYRTAAPEGLYLEFGYVTHGVIFFIAPEAIDNPAGFIFAVGADEMMRLDKNASGTMAFSVGLVPDYMIPTMDFGLTATGIFTVNIGGATVWSFQADGLYCGAVKKIAAP